jgi:hypothetical protein
MHILIHDHASLGGMLIGRGLASSAALPAEDSLHATSGSITCLQEALYRALIQKATLPSCLACALQVLVTASFQ